MTGVRVRASIDGYGRNGPIALAATLLSSKCSHADKEPAELWIMYNYMHAMIK